MEPPGPRVSGGDTEAGPVSGQGTENTDRDWRPRSLSAATTHLRARPSGSIGQGSGKSLFDWMKLCKLVWLQV